MLLISESPMPLEFQKRKALLDVMTSMFSTVDDLRTFLMDRTGRHLDALSEGALANRISRVLTKADEQEWLGDLVAALKEAAGSSAKATLDTIDVTGHF